ncbi:MAG: hypothetical protein AAFP00_01445 [Bacteroidota bacterium]
MRNKLHCFLLFSLATWPQAQALANAPQSVGHYPLIAAAKEEQQETNPIKALEEGLKKVDEKIVQPTTNILGKAQKASEDKGLEKILEEDIQREGLILGLISALTLLYGIISNILLYPAFSFLFFAMTFILMLLIAQLVNKVRKDEVISMAKLVLPLLLGLLIYGDLFMVMYEKNKILFLFLEFQKDIFLIVTAAVTGFLAGRSVSRKSFEEKIVP